MNKLWLIDIEAVDSRYTKQWKEHLPWQMSKAGILNLEVISGGEVPQTTTPGAFLNFAGTNSYKSQQLQILAKAFADGKVDDDDYFLYTDAWNPTVIQLKYMAELLGKKIKIGGLWHAGSYDPADFLGRLIGDKPWVRLAEESMYHCYDHNFFATDFHLDMFSHILLNGPGGPSKKNKIVGWPMEYLETTLEPYKGMEKKNKILFPHRIAPEKQLDIFKDLAATMPEFEWVICQERNFTKDEYHKELGEAKMVFSANLQETLGISCYEGALVGAGPMVPDRLSYSEMYHTQFKYPSYLTQDWTTYTRNKQILVQMIRTIIGTYTVNTQHFVETSAAKMTHRFFDGTKLYDTIRK